MRIVVLGGRGAIGSLVVGELRQRGHVVESASRSTGVDALGGRGLTDVIRGADAVVDCINVQTASAGRAIAGFGAVARHVSTAVLETGVPHLVALTIVGVQQPDLQRAVGYYRGKAEQERVLAASGAPVTLVRTTQWFELARTFLKGRVGPFALVPRMRSQPVAASAVAVVVADAVEAGFAGGAERVVAGPHVRDLGDLAAAIAASEEPGLRVIRFRIPGAGRLFDRGALLPGEDVAPAGPRFEEWLAAQPAARS